MKYDAQGFTDFGNNHVAICMQESLELLVESARAQEKRDRAAGCTTIEITESTVNRAHEASKSLKKKKSLASRVALIIVQLALCLCGVAGSYLSNGTIWVTSFFILLFVAVLLLLILAIKDQL